MASIEIANISDLADVSDYAVKVQEEGNIQMGIPPMSKSFIVDDHTRRGSVFRLLKRVLDKINE